MSNATVREDYKSLTAAQCVSQLNEMFLLMAAHGTPNYIALDEDMRKWFEEGVSMNEWGGAVTSLIMEAERKGAELPEEVRAECRQFGFRLDSPQSPETRRHFAILAQRLYALRIRLTAREQAERERVNVEMRVPKLLLKRDTSATTPVRNRMFEHRKSNNDVATQIHIPPVRSSKTESKVKGKNIDAQMLKVMAENLESHGWSVRKWGRHLKCSHSTIAESETWIVRLAPVRAMKSLEAAQRMDRSGTHPSGKRKAKHRSQNER